MDHGDPTSAIISKITTVESEHASKIIDYFLRQDMEYRKLFSIAFGPDILFQRFYRQAQSDLGLFSSKPLNPNAIPFNIHAQPLSQSSPRNGFLEFSRNPNSLSPSLTSDTLTSNPNFNSIPFRDGSPFFASSSRDFVDTKQRLSNHFPLINNENPFENLHKRSFLANDPFLESERPGIGGAGYRFPLGGLVDHFGSSGGFRSPSERDYVFSEREEMRGLTLAQQQRMAAAQFMAAPTDKEINFLRQVQNAQRQGSGGNYYSPSRHEREDSVSRKIFLLFPPESSFTEEDVSNYFSKFGEVEDATIPYPERRVFGFVTFANAETVRTTLARRNPHFICGSRVNVEPFKEKGKILQNERQKQQQQLEQMLERRDYSPSGIGSRDLYESHSDMTQKIRRRKAEIEAELQQEEIQRRRFLNLQLPDMDNDSVHHHQRSLSIGSPAHFPPRSSHSLLFQSENNMEEIGGGDSDRGENDFELVANSNEEGGYSIEFENGQEQNQPSLENSLLDGWFDCADEVCAREPNTTTSSDESDW